MESFGMCQRTRHSILYIRIVSLVHVNRLPLFLSHSSFPFSLKIIFYTSLCVCVEFNIFIKKWSLLL